MFSRYLTILFFIMLFGPYAAPVYAEKLGVDVTASAVFVLTTTGRAGPAYGITGMWSLSDSFSVGGRFERFDTNSLSSDAQSYEGDYMSGEAFGVLALYRFRSAETVSPFLSGRLQVMRGTRGPGSLKPATDHLALAPGLEVGMDLLLRPVQIGLFYKLDVPLVDYDDFGGAYLNYLFPGFRLGVSF